MTSRPTTDDLDRLLDQLRELRRLHVMVARAETLVIDRVRHVWPAEGDLVHHLLGEMEAGDQEASAQRIERLEFVIGQLRAQVDE